jgi:hypothetical protein
MLGFLSAAWAGAAASITLVAASKTKKRYNALILLRVSIFASFL